MKPTLIVVFMLVATAISAQKGTPATADKKAPVKDPTQLGDFLAPEILCLHDLDCTANPQFAAMPVEGRIRRLGNTLSSDVSERNASDLLITVYPNPATAASILTINMPQAGRALISLTDVQGKTAWKQETLLAKGLNSVEIRAPQGASGLFMWNVRTALDSQSGKLIFH